MSVGTISFYQMRGSLSSGEYPLLSADPSLSPIATFSDVLYRAGLQASADLPYFAGLEDANVAKIGDDYYWVTEYRERTADAKQYHFTLDFMAPTSMLRNGDSVTGAFHKTATNVCPYLKQEISNGLKMISDSYYPSDLEIGTVFDNGTITEVGYWLQVSGFTVDANNKRTGLSTVGFFIAVDTRDAEPSSNAIRVLGDPINGYYPTWAQIVGDITARTGFQADQIIDCSISKRCPFRFGKDEYTTSNATACDVYLVTPTGGKITPSLMSSGSYYYSISGAEYVYNIKLSDNVQTITIPTSSAWIRQCGSVVIRDWNENTLMEIPIDSTSIDIEFRCHSDISGIYTIVSHRDQQVSVPEGKLPYIENAWETYKAYQMNGDRQAMENAIKEANANKDLSNIVAVMNSSISAVSTGAMTGAIAGNIPGATVGIASGLIGSAVGIWENERQQELAEMQARNAFELSKRRAIDQPQTSYNVAYGLIYCALNELNALRVCLIMPYDVNSTYFTDWCSEYGYPCEGVRTVPITYGYYQGKINASATLNGMHFDELNRAMMQGFKFVNP